MAKSTFGFEPFAPRTPTEKAQGWYDSQEDEAEDPDDNDSEHKIEAEAEAAVEARQDEEDDLSAPKS